MVSMEYISSEVASAGASRAIILSRICPPSSLSLCLLCLLRVDEIVFVREAAKKKSDFVIFLVIVVSSSSPLCSSL